MENVNAGKMNDSRPMIAGLLLASVLLGALFYVRPLWDEVTQLSLGRDEKISTRDGIQNKINELMMLQQNLDLQSEVSLQTNLNAIPVGFEEDKLILHINALADESGVFMNGISFSIPSAVQPGEIGKVGINFSLTGSEGDLMTFLKKIESSSRKIVVKTIAVQLGATDIGNRISFNLSLETYFQGKK